MRNCHHWLQSKVSKQRNELCRAYEAIRLLRARETVLEHRVAQLENRLNHLEGDGVVY